MTKQQNKGKSSCYNVLFLSFLQRTINFTEVFYVNPRGWTILLETEFICMDEHNLVAKLTWRFWLLSIWWNMMRMHIYLNMCHFCGSILGSIVTFRLHYEFLCKVHKTKCVPLVQEYILKSVATNFTFIGCPKK